MAPEPGWQDAEQRHRPPAEEPLGVVVERFTELVLRHRRAVVLAWLILLVAGGAAASRLSDRLTFDFSLPGQPGYQTEQQLLATYGTSSDDTLVPVLTVAPGQTVQARAADVAAVFDTVRARLPQLRVVDLASTGDAAFVSADGRSTFALVQGPAPTGFGPGTEAVVAPVLEQAAAATGLQVGLTSYHLLSAGGDSAGPSVLAGHCSARWARSPSSPSSSPRSWRWYL